MLPAFCPAGASPGEREIFNLLRDDPLAAEWTALHSLDLAEHVRRVQGEADFVVLIPNEGIVVLEVKSHHSVRVDDRGWWLGHEATPEKRGPFKQASDALHSIRNYLEERNLAESLPMISAVVFPCLPFRIVSPEWHSWQVLDKQSLHAKPISVSLLSIIQRARKHFIAKGLSWLRVDAPAAKMSAITHVLRPRFEILASPETRRLALETNLLQCTEEQFGFLDLIASNDRALVSGLAGTGKTTLAVEAVRRIKAEYPDASVGLFCFNKFLGRKLEHECSGVSPPMKVGSLHNWMAKFTGTSHGSPEAAASDYWNSTLPGRVLEKLTAPGVKGGILDLLVLDEAQDLFREAWLDIFDLLLKGGLRDGRWMFFGDFERQDLFAQGMFSKNKFIDLRVGHRCAQASLSVNCRNTQEISTTLTLLAQLSPGYSKILRGDTRHTPQIIFYDSNEAQEKAALDVLQSFLGEGFKPCDIVLLSPYREKSLASRLAISGSWKGRLNEFTLDCSTTAYCTIHAFKGLEAAVVILTDIDHLDKSVGLDLFYTGMSRALHRLALLCHIRVREHLQQAVI
jgi:hypothetical protein